MPHIETGKTHHCPGQKEPVGSGANKIPAGGCKKNDKGVCYVHNYMCEKHDWFYTKSQTCSVCGVEAERKAKAAKEAEEKKKKDEKEKKDKGKEEKPKSTKNTPKVIAKKKSFKRSKDKDKGKKEQGVVGVTPPGSPGVVVKERVVGEGGGAEGGGGLVLSEEQVVRVAGLVGQEVWEKVRRAVKEVSGGEGMLPL